MKKLYSKVIRPNSALALLVIGVRSKHKLEIECAFGKTHSIALTSLLLVDPAVERALLQFSPGNAQSFASPHFDIATRRLNKATLPIHPIDMNKGQHSTRCSHSLIEILFSEQSFSTNSQGSNVGGVGQSFSVEQRFSERAKSEIVRSN